MLSGQSGDTAFLFKGQPDQFHFKFRGISFSGKSFFGAHEVSTCKISGCLSYRILDSGPDGTEMTLTLATALLFCFAFVNVYFAGVVVIIRLISRSSPSRSPQLLAG